MLLNCEFSEAVIMDENNGGDFEFTKLNCSSTNPLYELVENQNTNASFYLEKTFSYGDFFFTGILTLFVLFEFTKIIWNFLINKNNAQK